MHREKKRRKIIIASLLIVLLLMATGYAVFGTNLDIKGSTKVTSNWEVLITHITPGTPTGNAENTDGISPECDISGSPKSCNGLSAELSADLYEAGDSMEYIVTIENRGNLDAKLEGIDKGTPTNTNAVIITYSGYAEGQKLLRNSSMDIKVKVEYNPEYTEGEVTGESNISFSFVQAESVDDITKVIDDEVISKPDRTITYNCQENGGEEANQNSIFDVGDRVDLGVQCHKEGYTFLGWNTNKDAHSGIGEDSSEHTTLNNTSTDTTIYGIYSKTIDVKYKNEQLDDMNNWNKIYPERFDITYDNISNMNTIEVSTILNVGEQLYIPIETKIGTEYTVTFDYNIISDYEVLSKHPGIIYQAVTSLGINSYNDGKELLSIGHLPATVGSGSKTLTFTATTTKTYFDFNFGSVKDDKTVNVKLGNIRIKEGNTNIVKNSDTCTIYNKTPSCDFAVPTAILDNDLDNAYYELDGWYIGDTKIENPGGNHTYTDSVTVNAKITNLPVMMSGSNFQTKIDSVKSTVTEIEFVDTDEVTPPTINNTTSWDVSAKQNGSVIAWLDGTKMYIGGKGGVIGNSDCSHLFNYISNIILINFNDNFDTSNVTSMYGMFSAVNQDNNSLKTNSLERIDGLENFDTSKVTNMGWMFEYNSKLTNIDVTNFDTSKVTNIRGMFNGCSSLVELNLSKFDTSKSSNMRYMFYGCDNLTQLNLVSFDTSNVVDVELMFGNCTNLKTIYVSESFVIKDGTNSSNMFYDTTNLVGGNGTSYADKYAIDSTTAVDKTYAKIDKPGQEGYFTDASYPVIRNVSSVSTTNSITLTVDVWIPSGDEIQTIEFSKDNGTNWVTQGNSSIADNIYTFTGLDANTSYPIEIRVTSNKGKITTYRYRKYDKTTGTTIPTDNDLLFWGDASNPNNTDTILKNKSQRQDAVDGTMYNFNKTSKSGYNGEDLVFDGVDDYVNIGLANYDFQNSQSMVMYFKLNDISKQQNIFDSSQVGGGGIYFTVSKKVTYAVYDGSAYQSPTSSVSVDTLYYHTIVGTYDGQTVKIYTDGVLTGSESSSQLINSKKPLLIGSDPDGNGVANRNAMTNMNMKEALLYDRTLTETEVQEITNNFNMKYNGPMTNSLTTPTYEEIGSNQIKITYPSGCGSEFTCTYKVDDSTHNVNDVQNVTSTNVTVTYTSAGSITAEVIGTVNSQKNRTGSTYNLTWNDLYVSSTGNDVTGYGTLTAPYATMNKAYQSAKGGTTESTIYIMDDITVSETTNFNSNKNITLTSSDGSGNTGSNIISTVTRGDSLTGYVVNETAGELILENITIDGNKDNVSSISAILYNYSNCKINLNTGSTLKNNRDTNDYGGGIYNAGGEIILNGGVISDNVTSSGAAGIWNNNGKITIISGEIKDNSCGNSGCGIWNNGGSAEFTMSGGEISNNNSSSGDGGGLVVAGGTMTMNDGKIKNNTAPNGGGVNVRIATFTMTGGEISDNTATNIGGGIYAWGSGTVTISGTALINGNTATNNNGGGIYINSDKIFNMTGGTISNNTATNNGGGIYVGTNSSLTMSGGTISSNTATTSGGGIYAFGSGTVTISGTALIDGNEATGTTNSNGGGLCIIGGKVFNMTGGTISNNYCGFCGGGLVLSDVAEHFISGGTITNNEAALNSGGILLGGGTKLTMTGGTILNNIAPTRCGIFVYNGSTFEMNGGTIRNNTATNYDGGISKDSNSTINYISGLICGNTPSNQYDDPTTCPAS